MRRCTDPNDVAHGSNDVEHRYKYRASLVSSPGSLINQVKLLVRMELAGLSPIPGAGDIGHGHYD